VTEAILDIGLHARGPGSRVFAVAKGAIDAGMNVPHDDSALPTKERIEGQHVENYAKKVAGDTERYKRMFSGYLHYKTKPEELPNHLRQVEEKVKAGEVGK
jgi:large subunit ribosomal protein L18